MNVIILAAGIGSRLKPLTQHMPKSLLKIKNDKSILERTIDIINRNCTCNIYIVNGYMKNLMEQVKLSDNCNKIFNPFFRVSNSISSLWFAREYMNDETIIINADVIITEQLFKRILKINNDLTIFYDSSIAENADYKVATFDGKVTVMGKELVEYSGEYIGITKCSKIGAEKLRCKIDNMMQKEVINEWYETAIVDMIFNENLQVDSLDVRNYNWAEVDTINDLIRARQIVEFDYKIHENKNKL